MPVRLFCRSAAKAETLFGSGMDVIEGDLGSGVAMAEACHGIELIYHLGGLYQFGARHRAELWRTNVEGTRRLLAAARNAGVARIVHCSTAGVLEGSGRLLDHRDFPARPPAGCGYKISKWHAEKAALEAAAAGLDVVIACPTAPIGTGDDRPTPTGQMVLDLMRGRFPACSRTGFNIVAVDDVAAGFLAVGRRGLSGERYLLGNANLWLEDFLAQVAAQAGVSAPRAWVPWAAVALGGLVSDACGLLTGRGGERLCWETAYCARQRQFFDFQHSRDTIGWSAERYIPDAIADTVAWFSDRLGLPPPAGAEAARAAASP